MTEDTRKSNIAPVLVNPQSSVGRIAEGGERVRKSS